MERMKQCSKCKIEKPTGEFYKSKTDGLWSCCKGCAKTYGVSYLKKEKIRKQKVRGINYRKNNPERERARKARWKIASPDKVTAQRVRRRVSQVRAAPLWTDTKEIQTAILAFYTEAANRTRNEDCPFHVDHIVPLRGKNVCGLHVPWNLQVLPGAENCRKSNHWVS